MGIPGMGKTTILETHIQPHFEKSGYGFTSFASDKIRKELVDELSAKYKRDGVQKSKDQIFLETGRKAVSVFFDTLKAKILAGIESTTHSNHVIYLDKNHPPQALASSIENINLFVNSYTGSKAFSVHKVALVPDMCSASF